jgi:hypothetical protein
MPWAGACAALRNGTTPEAITAAGGLLLKAGVAPNALLLQLQPNFVGGLRTYHYDMAIPPEAWPAVSGDITPAGAIRLVFVDAAGDFPPHALRRTLTVVARALVDGGVNPHWQLTGVSREGLVEAGALDHCPPALGELAGLWRSG